jgi:hypothetical protein
MNLNEKGDARSHQDASVIRNSSVSEEAHIKGKYIVECFDKDGKLKWRDEVPNVVATVGKNAMLDAALAGSSYTVTGPFMGLISSVSFSAVAAADTMTSHGGWLEAGNTNAPTYSGTRKTCVWAAASAGSKALNAALSFGITGAGTIKGLFIVYGAGAVNTIDNTGGVLFSAGLFAGGDKVVGNTDTLNVSYSASI